MTESNNTTNQRRFLDYFEPHQRSHVVNLFLQQVRRSENDVERIVSGCEADLIEQTVWLRKWGNQATVERNRKILDCLNSHKDEALDLARWALQWERLPVEERKAQKAEKGNLYRRKWMETQPLTEKQISYLRFLGWTGEVKSKLHASELIDKLLMPSSEVIANG